MFRGKRPYSDGKWRIYYRSAPLVKTTPKRNKLLVFECVSMANVCWFIRSLWTFWIQKTMLCNLVQLFQCCSNIPTCYSTVLFFSPVLAGIFFWKLLNVPLLLCGLTIRCHLRHAASTRLMTTDNIILTSWYLKTIQNQNVLTKISMKAPCKLSKYLIKSS